MEFKVTSFYKYVNIKNIEELTEEIRKFCKDNDILGRILLAEEGINGAFSATNENTKKFKEWVKKKEIFSDLIFKEQECEQHVYHKLVVRKRNEIVSFGYSVDMKRTADHIPPEKLKEWIDSDEDIILLDARNKYEYKIGRFKGAKCLPINTFRDFPKQIVKLKDKKDKKIVMYCTGGVRCEKSSAFLKEEGFNNLYQLEGGIINFVNKFPENYFEGSCFVFDDRIVSHIKDNSPISKCEHCGEFSGDYVNCHNLDCDKLTIICDKCQEKTHKTCSSACFIAPRQRKSVSG